MEISEEKYHQMMKRIEKLEALEAGGVDNWAGYDSAMEEIRKQEEIDETLDSFLEDLDEILVEASVDQPAGPGCGYSIDYDKRQVRTNLRATLNVVQEILDRYGD